MKKVAREKSREQNGRKTMRERPREGARLGREEGEKWASVGDRRVFFCLHSENWLKKFRKIARKLARIEKDTCWRS